jgi:hypothetical protein
LQEEIVNNRRYFQLAILLVSLLMASHNGFTALAAGSESQGYGGPPVKLTAVAHYANLPDRIFSALDGQPLVEQIGYIPGGYYWLDGTVTYCINIGKQDTAFMAGIQAAFSAWDEASSFYNPAYGGTTKSQPGTRQAKWKKRLGAFTGAENTVGFKYLSSQFPDAIAVTFMWNYDSYLIEVDTALNTDPYFHWWQSSVSGDPDYAFWPSSQVSDAFDVDVQNIMTHEAGHWLVLNDIYNATPGFRGGDENLTMYGYAAENELKKRSLEQGDILGIRSIYGN